MKIAIKFVQGILNGSLVRIKRKSRSIKMPPASHHQKKNIVNVLDTRTKGTVSCETNKKSQTGRHI